MGKDTAMTINLPDFPKSPFQFKKIVPDYRWHKFHDTRHLSLRIPSKSGREGNKFTLMFQQPKGPGFLLVLLMPWNGHVNDVNTHFCPRIVPNLEPSRLVDTMDIMSRPSSKDEDVGVTECYQESPNGLVRLRVKFTLGPSRAPKPSKLHQGVPIEVTHPVVMEEPTIELEAFATSSPVNRIWKQHYFDPDIHWPWPRVKGSGRPEDHLDEPRVSEAMTFK